MLARLAPSKSYRARDLGYLRTRADLADGVLMLNCARGNKPLETAYDLQCERNEKGRLEIVYLAKRADADGTVYGVSIGRASALPEHCNCSGFGRWRACKHVAAVHELILRGEVPVKLQEPV